MVSKKKTGFNAHYRAHGYHPLLVYDGLTGDLLKAQLRNGTSYTSSEVVPFMKPLLDEMQNKFPDIKLYLRGDNSFAVPALYKITKHMEDNLNYLTLSNDLSLYVYSYQYEPYS